MATRPPDWEYLREITAAKRRAIRRKKTDDYHNHQAKTEGSS
jgi:hypothetical protein